MGGLPLVELIFSDEGGLTEEIDGAEEDVNMMREDGDLAVLCGNEAVLHGMGDPYGGVDADDPRGSFE